ncbi:MAG: hypothetical protein C0490_09000 [Marivirga sp.]|nr:hypothetical protein [Marivirga sp.]
MIIPMKKMNVYITQFMMLLAFAVTILVSCTEDEVGQPIITNVRVTEKDSTITGGEFNLTLAIQGTDLGSVQKVFFNDVEAYLNPVYVTNSNIIVTVPDSPPTTVSNKITVVTSSGQTASFDFSVVLPEPIVFGVYNEFALPGTENKVLGNYFYVISKVLVGETEVEITKVTANEITFIMPADAVVDESITIEGGGGTVTPTLKLHPTEGNMVNFDIPATGWGSDVCWGDAERIDPEDSDLEVISGRYTRIKQTNLPKTGYQGDWVISTCWFDFGLASASHATKMFKFEVNVSEAWKAGFYEINISTEDGSLHQYIFKPWDNELFKTSGFTTKGWKTIYIPLSNFKTTGGAQIADISKIRDFQFMFKTPDAAIDKLYVAADNFRIVDL